MSAEDIWQLKIPIRLSLSRSEISSPVDVKPVYLLAPRNAYLQALAQQCLGFFQHVLLSLPAQAHAGPAVSMQQQSMGASATAAVQNSAGLCAPAAPWPLTVHYRNMPASLSSTWQNAGAAKDYYFNSLKEAGFCCRGSDGCTAVMRLPGSSQDELWAAVNKGDGAAVCQHTTQLRMVPMQKQGAPAAIPVRLYIRRCKPGAYKDSSSHTSLLGILDQTYSTSRPLAATQPDGRPTRLAHVLNMVMPQRFPSLEQQPSSTAHAAVATASRRRQQQQQQQQHLQQEQQEQQQQPAGSQAVTATSSKAAVLSKAQAPGDDHSQTTYKAVDPNSNVSSSRGSSQPGAPLPQTTSTPKAAASSSARETSNRLTEKAQSTTSNEDQEQAGTTSSCVLPSSWPAASVMVCGVQPDWLTPLPWLYAHLRAADCFLYIVVHLVEPS
eukprot:GHRR01029326.1.p1 GENE.GHRR01029326.1~~GHRR01029326.1.p1  ORF type:complete len:438 (+),score=154.99 GHRR01029326.1:191-1504(+)